MASVSAQLGLETGQVVNLRGATIKLNKEFNYEDWAGKKT